MIAFSDHRLGVSLLATPLQWLGASPITAYNLTLLATFPLCALAAHWLAFTLTQRHDAAVIARPGRTASVRIRIAHLEHLELLAAFGMPAALAALHRYLDTRRRRVARGLRRRAGRPGACRASYYAHVLLGRARALDAVVSPMERPASRHRDRRCVGVRGGGRRADRGRLPALACAATGWRGRSSKSRPSAPTSARSSPHHR